VLADRGYALYCSESAYNASTIAIRIIAYSDEFRMAILAVRAPSWAKAAATDAAARNGMNMGSFRVGMGTKKSALDGEVEGAVVAMIGLMLTDSVVSMTERETYLAVDFNTSKQVA